MRFVFALARADAESDSATRIAIMAMTTSNSINVNAPRAETLCFMLLSWTPPSLTMFMKQLALHRGALDNYIRNRYKDLMKSRSVDDFLPLTPAVFHILLSLSDTDRHGYAIMQDVHATTKGQIRM